jgi:hypothetical protein
MFFKKYLKILLFEHLRKILVFCMSLLWWLGLPHPSIVSFPQCVYTHTIDPMGIHFLHYTHGNEHIGIHDVIHMTPLSPLREMLASMWDENNYKCFPSTTLNSSYPRVDIVLTKDGIRIIADVVITNPMCTNLCPFQLSLFNSCIHFLNMWCVLSIKLYKVLMICMDIAILTMIVYGVQCFHISAAYFYMSV